MADREKVIQALGCCSQGAKEPYTPTIRYCAVCPYPESEIPCTRALARDALELLKAQEARVMTLVELWHMEHKPVYLERKNSRLYITEPSIVLKTERCYFPFLGDSYILMRENKIHDKYWACDYNKTWRCWTSRPTDEQTEATPWN